MKENKSIIEFYGEDFFGALTPYIEDIDVTDILCNARHVWINHVENGISRLDIDFSEKDIESLAYKISNIENVQFNNIYPVLQADLDFLRFEFTHKSITPSGTTCSIRKTPVVNRITPEGFKKNEVEYLTEKTNNFLKRAIESRLNSFICGLTGCGKTELAKYLMGFTKYGERIITIEDTCELHLAEIYEDKDIVEFKVNEILDFDEGIKTSMRMFPVWVLLSEARSKEVKELLKSISTGARIVSTIHCDDARQLPRRILNMFEDNELSNEKIESMIYDYLDLGIHVKATFNEKTVRYIDQIVYFEVDENGNNVAHEIYKVNKHLNGTYEYIYRPLPESLLNKLEWSEELAKKEWC